MEMRFIPAEDLEIVDCKRQNENVTGQLRKCGPRKASLGCLKRRDLSRFMAMRQSFKGCYKGYVGFWWGRAWLWSRILIDSLCIFFSPLTHIFRMTGRQLFTLVVDGLQELMKVILLLKLFSIYCHSKIFLLCTRLISDIWWVDASTNFCIGLCRMLVGLMIMIAFCFVVFICWFMNQNSDIRRSFLCETQKWIIDCMSRCSALHQTKRSRGNWKFNNLMFCIRT